MANKNISNYIKILGYAIKSREEHMLASRTINVYSNTKKGDLREENRTVSLISYASEILLRIKAEPCIEKDIPDL